MKKLLYVLLLLSYCSYGQESTIEKQNYTVTDEVTLTATQSIKLKPLTWIKSGATFTAKIVQAPYVPLVFSNENYVFNRVYRKAMTSPSEITSSSDVIESIAYFDGLGRGKQSIGIRQGTSGKDIVTHMEYDALGRQTKEYLPYAAATQNGLIRTGDVATATKSYYQTNYSEDFAGVSLPNVNAYSEKILESSPLNRVFEQTAPGKDWVKGTSYSSKGYTNNSHSIKFEYQANAENEVRAFGVDAVLANNTYTPSLTVNSSYLAGTLYKTVTKDENWESADGVNHTTEEFKNKQGQVVLKRTYNNSEKHDTYYVYDKYGNLTYVLPPKMEGSTATLASITSKLNDLGYQYKYDHRNRLVEKRIPGKEWEYIVYDKLDRPVLTQDANLRAENKWLFTKYDVLGRVAYTGKHLNLSIIDRVTMQNTINTQYNIPSKFYEERTDSGIHYNNSNFPSNDIELLTINYYDDYAFDRSGAALTVTNFDGKTSTSNAKSLATGSKVRVLGTNNWITTVTYYDEKARPIYVYSKNDELQTTDIVESKLDDFTGRILETKTTHKKTGHVDVVTIDKFYYDNLDRLIKQTQTIGSNTEVIVENSYDELGQLVEKKVGGKVTQSRLQTIDYKYNVRGWLKNINQDANNDNDLFNFSLKYNDITDANKRLYNGNISQTSWNTLNTDTSSKTYIYNYDALNRILGATGVNGSNYNVSGITYDKNGNILSLIRNGHTNVGATSFGVMDNLVYSYDNGNKLTKVLDNGNDIYGFKDGANTSTEYTYDVNGNMKTDANKGITNIVYNHLNLPTQVSIGGQNITYTYDAAGMKLKKVVNGTTTEYAGNYMYENNVLQFFNHPEGYVKKDNTGFKYVYQYKDHLGNVRLSYTDNNNDGVITPSTEIVEESNYYPFGLKHKGYNGNVSSLGNSVAQKKGFANEELEEELGKNTIAYQWRDYDPAIGRFGKVDRFAEKYYSITPYHFTANNPVFFREIAGDSIDVGNLLKQNPEGLKELTKSLESLTGLALTIDSENNLVYETEKGVLGIKKAKVKRDSNGKRIGSSIARRRLKRAIKNKKTIRVRNNRGGGTKVSKNRKKMYFDFGRNNQIKNTLSLDLNPETMGQGMIFMHELDHTIVGKSLSDINSNILPGDVVRRVNQIRRQLGPSYGQRAAYDPTVIGDFNYVPFSSQSLEMLKSGVAPTIQYMKF